MFLIGPRDIDELLVWMNSQLCVGVLRVGSYGVFLNHHVLSDIRLASPLRDERGHFGFALR